MVKNAPLFIPRVGHWLPSDFSVIQDFIDKLIQRIDGRRDAKPLDPVIQDFKDTVENDAQLYMLFTAMLKQVPTKPPYDKDPTGQPQVRDYHLMFALFNEILSKAPEYNGTDLVGFPINAILDWPMATHAGFAAFLNSTVNAHFQQMLNRWAEFLVSPESCYVLTDDPTIGWFSPAAQAKIAEVGHGSFEELFVCDPSKPYYGYKSWDDFFIREFKDGVRKVAAPDEDCIIVNACESAPYRLAKDINQRDRFWLKSQKYSLQHMLNNDELYPEFLGGTVYQAFLSALSYHRWHSPVSGTIKKAYNIPGTYYSETWAVGYFDAGKPYPPPDGEDDTDFGPDPAAPNDSQGYITEVAARAIIFIEADNPDIGLMCFMGVGMAEVSSCEITVKEGQHVSKGEQIGTFHFGGSTHCLMFRPGVNVQFDLRGQTPGLDTVNIPVRDYIAVVTPVAKN